VRSARWTLYDFAASFSEKGPSETRCMLGSPVSRGGGRLLATIHTAKVRSTDWVLSVSNGCQRPDLWAKNLI
jgi:hypothetical protein